MKNKQITNTVLMIEPVAFRFNQETASNNHFQHNDSAVAEDIQQQALKEFHAMVEKLENHGIHVIVIKDTPEPYTPDSIFPNNWVSFHEDKKAVLYPMFAPNRREERREDILYAMEELGFDILEVMDYTSAEDEDVFLEGTGSVVLDRTNQIAYAAISERTDDELFVEFCEDLEFTPIVFHATQTIDGEELPIYHTNVMMSVCENFALICFDSIKNLSEKKLVSDFLLISKKEIISISEQQMNQFAGNCLELKSESGDNYLVMSNTAYQSLNKMQISEINKFSKILVVDIPTIEKYGGGSARCMMAEVFLPKSKK